MSQGKTRLRHSPYIAWAKEHHDVRYNLASSGVAPPTLEQLGASLDDLSLVGPHEEGWQPLKQRIAERYQIPANQVTLTQGASMANHLVCALLLEPGDEVLFEQPGYEPLATVAELFHAKVRTFERIDEHGYPLDPETIESLVSDKTKLLICSNLHNPTGVLAEPDVIELLGEIAEQRDFYVLVDEVYLEWLYEEGARTAAGTSSRIVTTRSLTKAYGLDAVRAGWVLASPEITEGLHRLMDLFSVKLVHASERLAARALDHAEALLAPARERLSHNCLLVHQFIDDHYPLDWYPPAGGSVGFIDLAGGSVDRLETCLAKRDTAIAPGRFFGAPGKFRLGFGMATADLEEGLRRLDAALQELG